MQSNNHVYLTLSIIGSWHTFLFFNLFKCHYSALIWLKVIKLENLTLPRA